MRTMWIRYLIACLLAFPAAAQVICALGTGAATCWLRLASAAGPLMVGYLVAERGTAGVFLMFAAAGIIGAAAAMFMLETRNRRLEDIAP